MEKTRSAVKCPLFGDIGEMRENVLPTYEDIMKQYEWTRFQLKSKMENPKEPSFAEIVESVSSKVEEIWHNASLPTVSHTRILQMLRCFHLKCRNIKRSLKRLTQDKKYEFLAESRVLFDICSCKCKNIQQCNCQKDKKVPIAEQKFLVDQRTSRRMIIGGVDVTFTKALQKRFERQSRPRKRPIIEESASKSSLLDVSRQRRRRNVEVPPVQDPATTTNQKSSQDLVFSTLAKTCDRYGVSDRAAAAIASSVLYDIKSDVSVIDRNKLRRERAKTRKNITEVSRVQQVSALYFDGRKDKTLRIVKKSGRNYKETIVEEHISLVKEPDSVYLGYVVPTSGSAKDIVRSITDFLSSNGISENNLLAIGCDGTNVNTGKYGGAIRLLETHLGKPLQWIICLLHMNELPLRHLFLHLDGSTSGPRSYTGEIGKLLEKCELMPVIVFQPIEGSLPTAAADLSTDQLYLHKIVSAVTTGILPEDLANKSPGKLSHARWLTRANRILRLYVATESPSQNLITLATFVIKVYAPLWFATKCAPSCKEAARHFYAQVSSSRYLPRCLKMVVDPVLQRNSYSVHPENLLLSMLTDNQKNVRELAVQRILQARASPPSAVPRLFEVPKLNFNATSYTDLIDWQAIQITAPPLLQQMSDEEINAFIESSDDSDALFFRLPNHTQAVERAVKLTTEASTTLCLQRNREGLIKAKVQSRKMMPKFESKKDFNA